MDWGAGDRRLRSMPDVGGAARRMRHLTVPALLKLWRLPNMKRL